MTRTGRDVYRWTLVVLGVLTLALLAVLWRRTRSQEPQTARREPIKAITFNVQFLPSVGQFFNKRPDAEYRARTLGQALAAYDIIGLNEVFDLRPRQLLVAGLRERLGDDFHCVTAPASERSAFGIDSGLLFISRLPIRSSHSLRFGNDSSVWKHGPAADGFAAKGVLHARIGRSGETEDFIDAFITHLESYDDAIREAQYSLLTKFIHKHSDPHRPVLVMGDFNTDGRPRFMKDRGSPYHRMMTQLQQGRPGALLCDLWPLHSAKPGGTNAPETADGGKRIDYIFISNPAGGNSCLTSTAVRVNPFRDSKVLSLSDHSAVEVDLEWYHP